VNTRLKKLLAESVLENEVIKEALRKKSGERASAPGSGTTDGRTRAERAAVAGYRAHERQRLSLRAAT
jgi:putative transposase